MTILERYPNICRATKIIALENGGINRLRTEEQRISDLTKWLGRQEAGMLMPIDAWLGGLSEDDLQIVCCGVQEDIDAILVSSPPFTDNLLNRYFGEVC